MKIRFTLLLILALLSFQLAYSQKFDNIFSKGNEVYFNFRVNSKDEIKTITKLISIDNFKNDTVWAYANRKQFEMFSESGYKINILPHPGDGPGVIMRDKIKLLKGTKTTWNFYPTYPAYEALMTDFQAMYPSLCHLETITTLPSGRKIIAAKISDNVNTNEAEPEFFYTSSMHGDETTGYVLMLQLIEYLLQNYGINSEVTDLVNNMEIYINPLANPDGTYYGGDNSVSGARRYNINGVDINRNFPDPEDGDHPDGYAWQPETIAFMNFAEQHDFVASANFHGGVEVVNYPWDTWETRSVDDSWWQYVSREYADTVHIHAVYGYMDYLNNGITNGYDWYEVAGGRQDYMNYFHNCREFTVELSNTKLLPAAQLPAHWNYNHRSFILFMKQATYGFRGTITDQVTGNPVEAKVTLVGHDALNTEVYSTALNGDYYRPVKAGTYTMEISAPCYITQTINSLTITDKTQYPLNIQLVPDAGVATSPVTSITSTTAISGGEVLCEGSSSITARGVCWGTALNPLVTGAHTTDGSGSGTYVSSISGLSANTTYYVRAYATNLQGTVYGENIQFTTGCGSFSLPFSENFSGTAFPSCWTTSVSGTGTVHNWSVSNTTNAGGTAREMKSTYQNINPATTRLVTPSINTTGQSQLNLSFRHMLDAYGTGTTLKIQSSTDGTTWTDESWSIASTSSNISATTVNTTITHNLNNPGTLIAFSVTGNLNQYDYWYIDNVAISGTVSNLPVVSTTNITSVTSSSAITGGVVTSGGSSGVIARGVCYGTATNPDINGSHTTDGSGTGSFTSTLNELTPATTYYVRAYATNSSGTAYGSEVSFSTSCISVHPIAWIENFENGGAIPNCWTQEEVSSSGVSWTFITGNGSGHPTLAHSGIYNACLKDNNSADNKTRLITPTLDMNGMINVTLSFWHTQAVWSGDQDQLTVLYKTSSTGIWTTLATYNASITAWTQEFINLPNVSEDYYIAFEGNAKYGYGVCIDDVSITGSYASLSVNPTYQSVDAEAGQALFEVISNTAWTAISNQPWCNVTPEGSFSGMITAEYEANPGTSARVAQITVTAPGTLPVVVTLSQEATTEKILNLTVLFEGLFNGNDMNKAQNETGSQYPGNIADEITVEMHNSFTPFELVGLSYILGVNTDGTAQLSVPANLNLSYYVVIKHRNSIETWSHDPISFSQSVIDYDFTDAVARAYGNNLKNIAGKYVIYSGDVNQDKVVDLADMVEVDNNASGFVSGYLDSDVNGDGVIDIADMTIPDNNSSAFIHVVAP